MKLKMTSQETALLKLAYMEWFIDKYRTIEHRDLQLAYLFKINFREDYMCAAHGEPPMLCERAAEILEVFNSVYTGDCTCHMCNNN